MTMVVREIPAYFTCGACGYSMSVAPTSERTHFALVCYNERCPNFDRPHWFRPREVTLEEAFAPPPEAHGAAKGEV